MKALLVSGIYPPDIGGPASYIPKLASQLAKRGFNVHVISLTDGKRFVQTKDSTKVHLIPRKIPKYIRIPLTVIAIFFHGMNADFRFANGLYEEVGIVSFILRKKFVFKIVGDPIWERFQNSNSTRNDRTDSFKNFNIPKKFALQSTFFKWSIQGSAGVTTPGKELAEVIKERYQIGKVTVIANGVDIPTIPNHGPYKFDLISVSRLVPWKHVEILVEMALKMNLSLLVVGDGPDKLKLIDLASGGAGKIVFSGNLVNEQVQELLGQSRIFALLSEYEGMSFSLLEAMAFGKRILVSNIPANFEVIGESDFACMVNPQNSLDLEASILELLPDSDENFRREKAAQAWAREKFSNVTQVNQMIDYATGILND
jgi:glycosyltransferase involved in cell wall biosynthesis